MDGYLEASQEAGRGVRMGVLTDGRHWFLRWPGAGPARTEPPYAFVLDDAEGWIALYEWLRDRALGASERVRPARETVAERFGALSLLYQRDLDALRRLHRDHRDNETVQVKRRLWLDLLRAATGEFADSVDDLDDLFVRHTYLTAVTGMAVQARFRIDIAELARTDAADLLAGRRFRDQTGLQGVVETDFFSWPAEVGGEPLLRTIARRLARFDWTQAPADIAAILYETVIPADERRQLGEYYTPHWLVRAMLDELVPHPLEQRVLDPACGSGTFIAEAVTRLVKAAEREALDPESALGRLREAVVGIDVHPVAVHLARSAWTIAAQPLIERAVDAGFRGTVSAPVYLGDSLQLRFGAGELLAEAEVRIEAGDEQRNELIFPTSLVERADLFDDVMIGVAGAIARGEDPLLELSDHALTDAGTSQPRARSAHDERYARRRAQSHLGLLHPESRAAGRARAPQGRRDHWEPAVAELQPDGRRAAQRTRAAEQGGVRHLGRRQVRHTPRCRRLVLRSLRRPVPRHRRRDRHGDAAQRPRCRAAREVAERALGRAPDGLRLQAPVGSGTTQSERLLPHSRLCRVRTEGSR